MFRHVFSFASDEWRVEGIMKKKKGPVTRYPFRAAVSWSRSKKNVYGSLSCANVCVCETYIRLNHEEKAKANHDAGLTGRYDCSLVTNPGSGCVVAGVSICRIFFCRSPLSILF